MKYVLFRPIFRPMMSYGWSNYSQWFFVTKEQNNETDN